MKRICFLIFALLCLTSCNFLPNAEGEELLKAPMLNQMQKSIYDELERTVSTTSIVYTYPKYGEQRSPFVFSDMNGDGLEEVIVFYSYKDNIPELFAKVLVQDGEGGWNYLFDIPCRGSSVDSIDFAPFFDSKQSSLVIGWAKGSGKFLSVYSMTSSGMVEGLYIPYHHYIIDDIDNNEISELIAVQTKDSQFSLGYYGFGNDGLGEIGRVPLYEETIEVEQILLGKIDGARKAVYIDEEMVGASVSYGTEIIEVTKGGLKTLVGSTNGKRAGKEEPVWEAFAQTFRAETLSLDLGNDGVIEVPRLRELSDYLAVDSSGEEDTPNLIEYMQYKNNQFVVESTAVKNQNFGYLVYFPGRWIGNVTIVEHPQRQEWRFHKISPTNGTPTTELLRIRVFQGGSYMTEVSTADFNLDTKGIFSYYGYIPDTGNEPLAVTKREVEGMFTLN